MSDSHDYTIIGHPRAMVGRYLGMAAALVSPFIASTVVSIATSLKLTNKDIAALTISSGLVYFVLYWLFNNFGWRLADKLLKTPNLSGDWDVVGRTLNDDSTVRFEWKATIKIVQKWDKICIAQKTSQSTSYSETASIRTLATGDVRLSYSYQNRPQVGEKELEKHQGFCELDFDAQLARAEGHYFNAGGRKTMGRMFLTKTST